MTSVHHYWHNPIKTDLSKMRDAASRGLRDKKFPEESVIHKHPYDSECLGTTVMYRDLNTHEFFLFQDLED